MSFLGISIAGSALDAYQLAENVTSQNIANVQTPGASRQQVIFGQTPPIDGSPYLPGNQQPGTQGTGVYVEAIQRVHENSYDALFRGATSSQNYYSVEQQVLQGLQSALGEPGNGINTAYSNFQTSLQTLSNNPQGSAERTGVLTAAQALVTSLNQSGASIQSSETSVQGQASSLITTINGTIDQIAALNGQIRAETAAGDNPNTYEDQRDQLIDTLSTYVSVQTSVQADGSALVTVDGHAVVNDTVTYHLGSPVVETSPTNGTPSLVVGFANDPTPANPTPLAVGNGQLGGLLDVYNTKLQKYASQLNDFANGLSAESARLSQAGYDLTGQPGGQLFVPVVTQLPVSAGNIQVGITTASEFPAGVASTAAGTLIGSLAAANNTVDTTAAIVGNTTLANPATAVTGTLTIEDDGIAGGQQYRYSTVPEASSLVGSTAAGANTITVADATGFVAGDKIVVGTGSDAEFATIAGVAGNVVTLTAGLANAHVAGETAGGNAGTINGFINSFNAGHYGVTASFDPTAQRIVFSRDPANIDLVHRALQGTNSATPDFTITDSNLGVPAPAQPALGAAATSLFTALGANAINGVDQNASNAYGNTSAGGANALLTLFSQQFGVPSLQTTSGAVTNAAPGQVTLTGATPTTYSTINIGDVLTIDAGTPDQENVTVTAVSRIGNGSISYTAQNPHPNAGYSVTTAQSQTLQTFYSNFVAQYGSDTQTATTGNSSQTALASNVNAVRQSVDGINIDEETQNLIKFQNAYAAAAHVVNTLNEMLATAIGLGS